MTTTVTTSQAAEPTFVIQEEIRVNASMEATFNALLQQMGPMNQAPDGSPLPMQIEARPGGRWYRDLGGDNGHCWGFVQSINRPALLEIWGPLFMSSATTSKVLYRLTESGGVTMITFTHTLVGPVADPFRSNMRKGWESLHARVKAAAEGPA